MIKQLKRLMMNSLRNRLYAFLNIVGLSVALLSVFIVFLWVFHESGYDKFNTNYHRIYQINNLSVEDGMRWDGTPSPLAPAIIDNSPGVEQITRIVRFNPLPISYGENSFIEENGISSDPEIFDIFSFKPIAGNVRKALQVANTMVVTESFARRYFGDEDPHGKDLILQGRFPITIQAVIEDVPAQSHLQFDFILSHELAKRFYSDEWGNPNYLTYILIHQDANATDVLNSITQVAMENQMPNIYSGRNNLILRPLKDIYLDNGINNRVGDTGDKRNVLILSLVGLLILLMACFNYVNISVSLITKRLKTSSIQKIHGASRRNIFFQSLSMSVFIIMGSYFISLVLLFYLLPWFESFTGKEVSFILYEPMFILILLLVFAGTVVLSGIYPALLLSRPNALSLFQVSGNSITKSRKFQIIAGLQSAISITLIICTIAIYKQMSYLRQKDLGFSTNQIVYFQLSGIISTKIDAVKGELEAIPGIQQIAMKDCVPFGIRNNTRAIMWRENSEIKNTGDGNYFNSETTRIDTEYFKMMEVEFSEGRNFDESFQADKQNFILNEEAVRQMQLDNPVGQEIALYGEWGIIVGVIKDTYFKSLHEKIQPQVFHLYKGLERESNYSILFLRVAGSDIPGIISQIEDIWRNHNPGIPFEYHFLDEQYDMLYKSDKRMAQFINLFSALAVFVACLGLFGQSVFAADNRTKEIGIRKVNGAKVWEVMAMMNIAFVKWVIISFVIATPVAWYAMNRWLQNFAYRTELSWWVFATAGLLALIIALLTVSWQSLMAARRNPVEALRYE
jgi:putative ABC transport system permease protein